MQKQLQAASSSCGGSVARVATSNTRPKKFMHIPILHLLVIVVAHCVCGRARERERERSVFNEFRNAAENCPANY